MTNPFDTLLTDLKVGEETFRYYNLNGLKDDRVNRLPYSIKILLESALRNCDNFAVNEADIEKICDWSVNAPKNVEIPFKPARVILQDFTGVPSVVDLAAMRSAMVRLGGDPNKINPKVPADLVIDHSVQVDSFRSKDAVEKNLEMEMKRNHERFSFLKWGSKAFENFRIVPPGGGIVHQVNLEYLARSVFNVDGLLYNDSVVGTDSHTTMIDGLGVAGWGVGGIEAEAVMLGQAISMVLPQVVGYKLTGKLPQNATATDLVLTITKNLRDKGVVGKFVEFYGPGLVDLSLADRATIANMSPEYGATMGFFPVDKRTMEYLEMTNRNPGQLAYIEAYLRAQGMFLDHDKEGASDPIFTDTLTLDLGTIVPCVAGPKRPHDRVEVTEMKKDFLESLTNPVGFKGFGLPAEELNNSVELDFEGKKYTLKHGALVIAAITSCTNTSNPSVLLGAGLLAKRAVEKGLSTLPFIKTSLAPGSGVVTQYLKASGLQPYLDQLGFNIVGYGCTSCIGNSGAIHEVVEDAVNKGNLVSSAVLSGNRNFEGRVHALTRANFLASPPLVVAYALAGTTDFDFETQPLGQDKDGNDVFLRELWPSANEIQEVVAKNVHRSMFKEVYATITKGTKAWNSLNVAEGTLFEWDEKSTYIHHPPFFQTMGVEVDPPENITDAFCLLNLGDSITTDHISPAGQIARNSPAAKYLADRGISRKDFNTYGSRRGNDEIMARGTFANIRLVNKFVGKAGPYTLHVPSGEIMAVWDAAEKYMEKKQPCIIFGGRQYGSGSSRDWAAKGPMLQGVRAVIAISYERIHRSNLVGMGIMPLQFKDGEDAESLGLTGKENFSIDLVSEPLSVNQMVTVNVSNGKSFQVVSRLDTEVELAYYKHGGILNYVIRKLL